MRYLKKLCMLIMMIIILIQCAKSSNEEVIWIEDYQQALELAKQSDKIILVNFTGSDWCVWCHRLTDEVFTKSEFIDYANSNFVLLKIDFPNNIEQPKEVVEANNALARKYDVRGFPTILLIDKDENVIATTGYQPGGAKEYVNHLKELIP